MVRGMSHKTFLLTRASRAELNATQFGNLATMFASAAAAKSTVTLLVTKEDGAIRDYLHLDETAVSGNAHLTLAQALGAAPVEADLPDHIDAATVLGHATYDTASTSRDTQHGAENADFARAMAPVIGEGEWIAVTARSASKKESAAHLKWLTHRMGTSRPTHHSMTTQPLVVTIRAGADTADRVTHLLNAVTAAAPGFDLVIKTTVEKKHHPTWKALFAGAPLTIAGAALTFTDYAMAGAGVLALGVLACVLGLAALTHKIPSPSTALATRIEDGEFPTPPKRSGKPRAPHDAYTKKIKGRDGEPDKEIRVDAFDGDYPIHPDTFYVGPSVFAGLISPHTGTGSEIARTRDRATPKALERPCGFNAGVNATDPDSEVHIPATDAAGGVAVLGAPGMGKTYLMLGYFGFLCAERVNPCGAEGYPGASNSLIIFESKDAAPKYKQWARAAGDRTLLIDVLDPRCKAIDVFAIPGVTGAAATAAEMVDAMEYIWGEVLIGPRSRETLTNLMTAALVVDETIIDSIADRNEATIPAGASPFMYLYILLGGHGDEAGNILADAIKRQDNLLRSRGQIDEELATGAACLVTYYNGKEVSPSARRTLVEAPRNKVRELIPLEPFFTPSRGKVTFERVLKEHKSVVINVGVSPTGGLLSDSQMQNVSSLMMYVLYRSVMNVCSGWQDAGRRVTLMTDELSTLAGNNESVFSWMRDKGRSFGVELFLATQRPEQLPKGLRANILTYLTLISFAQTDHGTAVETATNVSGQGVDFTPDEITGLDMYHAVIRTHANKRRQPAVEVAVHDFGARMNEVATMHAPTRLAGAR